MKKAIIFFALILLTVSKVFSQVGISNDNSIPHPSAGLDVNFNNKGFLPPRMTFLQRNSISNPSEGLIVMCTNCGQDGQAALCIFLNGKWQTLSFNCLIAANPVESSHLPNINQITWKWRKSPIALGYILNTTYDTTAPLYKGIDTSYTETGLTCVTPYTRYLYAYNICGLDYNNPTIITCTTSSSAFPAPSEGSHIASGYQVNWNWNPVPDALGYRWNNVNDYSSAVDVGTATTYTQSGLDCGSTAHSYVWAYSTCGVSSATMLTMMTASCPSNCMPLNDSRDGTTYPTVFIANRCWMKKNLNIGTKIQGSQNQTNNSLIEKYCYNNADSNCNVYGGLYQWAEMVQYLNGASNTSSWSPVPSTPVVGICPTGWHIPSSSEWNFMVTSIGGSTIAGNKMKEFGYQHWLSSNTSATNASGFTALGGGRGGYGYYSDLLSVGAFWEATGEYAASAYSQWLSPSSATIYEQYDTKSGSKSVRCIKDCDPVPAPAAGTHVPGVTQVVWNWNSVPGASSYLWNTVNDFGSAISVVSTTYTETGVPCGTSLTRYVWAVTTDCGNSSSGVLTATTLNTGCPTNCVAFTDSRDGKNYSTVLIGTQCWMAQNLNVGTKVNVSASQTNNSIIEKYCYGDLESNCDTYGALYQWNEMMNYSTSSNNNPSGRTGICPTGWHIPSDAEWCQLETLIEPNIFFCTSNGYHGDVVGAKMKESGTVHWTTNTGATNSTGFTGLPGGNTSSGLSNNLGTIGYFWSATESSSSAYYRDLEASYSSVYRATYGKALGVSVRCVKD